MDKLGDRSQDELASDGVAESSAHSRRDFLKKAAGAALALPAAGAAGRSRGRSPEDQGRRDARSRTRASRSSSRRRRSAPTRRTSSRSCSRPSRRRPGSRSCTRSCPWNVEGATYATNYAGPNPFDVSYQTSTDLTGLGTKGVLEVLNTAKWLNAPSFASTTAKFIPNAIAKSTYQGKLYGLPCIIGGTVVYYNKDLLAKAGVTQHPDEHGRRWPPRP